MVISRGSPVALSREPNQWVRPFRAEGYPTFGLGFAEVPHGHPFQRDCTRPEGYHKGRLSFLSSGEPSLVSPEPGRKVKREYGFAEGPCSAAQALAPAPECTQPAVCTAFSYVLNFGRPICSKLGATNNIYLLHLHLFVKLNTQEAVAWRRTLAQFCQVGYFTDHPACIQRATPSSKDGKASVHGGTPTTKTGEASAVVALCSRLLTVHSQ